MMSNIKKRNKRQYRNIMKLIDRTAWEAIKRRYNYTCPVCGRKEPEIKLTKDHIHAKSQGGMDVPDNWQPLCEGCNREKGTRFDWFTPLT
jgi:5-methylcytosine-specific restriction endonuclease McrA